MKKLSLMEVLEGIEDTRRERSVWYPLEEVLFIMLVAVICGATSYTKVELFGKSKEEWLKKHIKLENGVPDACTFRNVIKTIDTQQLHKVFIEWMGNVVEHLTGVVAVDGKQARRTKDGKKKPLHVVSAFSAECGLVLGQLACEEKSNEITAIPKLLEMLEIEGCIVTIDAMGTQSEIAEKIIERGADYILALKDNQRTLCRDVALYFEEYRKESAGLPEACCASSYSQGHGRYESRTCYICEDIGWLDGREKWKNLSGIGAIFSKVEEKGKISTSPNGNGGWYSSMYKWGVAQKAMADGVEWLNVFAVDNVLQRIADPCFVGAVIANKCASGAKVVKNARRTRR